MNPAGMFKDVVRSSYQQVLDRAEGRKSAGLWDNVSIASPRADWTGFVNLDEALDLCRTGWAEGAAKMSAIESLASGIALAPVPSLAIAGHFPVVPEFLAGNPECMIDLAGATEPRRLTVVMTLSTPCTTSGSWMRDTYAPAVAATLRGLQVAGISVAVVGIDGGGGETDKVAHVIDVCRHGDALDLDRRAMVAHPAFLRRVMFANRETMPGWKSKATGNYGRPLTLDDGMMDVLLPGERAVMLPGPAALNNASAADCVAAMVRSCMAILEA